jgi:vacuolar-type H+-ATPase catalytic subunit A/Vma1
MKIARTSPVTGKVNTMEIDVTQAQLDEYYDGMGLIQEILPNLTAEEREFIKTGITPDEFDAIFA